MRIEIVQIGNSKGIRLPKSIIESCHLKDAVELEVEDGVILLRGTDNKPRDIWVNAFKKMALQGDDKLLEQEVNLTRWEDSEWQW